MTTLTTRLIILFISFKFTYSEIRVSSETTATGDVETQQEGVQLPPLPYDYNALEPHVSERTLLVHHDKHHAKVNNNKKREW